MVGFNLNPVGGSSQRIIVPIWLKLRGIVDTMTGIFPGSQTASSGKTSALIVSRCSLVKCQFAGEK